MNLKAECCSFERLDEDRGSGWGKALAEETCKETCEEELCEDADRWGGFISR